MNPTFGSLFAGVGGFDLGFEAAGYDCKFQVEWDKHCQQVLAYHWPDVPRWGDVSEVDGADLPPVDVITYGFPCQDLSVAGKRAGLNGDRSNLFFEAIRIITEMRESNDHVAPAFAVAENVPGLLTADGGYAMARVLDTLAEAGAVGIEWCVLDAQWFGVPQRRRRVFVTACFDSATFARCPDPLFPVAESGARNPAEIDQEREAVAGAVTAGVGSGGLQRVTETIAAGAHPGSYNGQDAYNDMLIPFTKGRRAQSSDDYETWDEDRPAPTLNEFDNGDIRTTTAVVFDLSVRRLTPVECERLMGWPDNHTLYRADGKDNSDSQRYKQCGNGVAAPVARWIAKHLRNVLEHDRTPPAGER